MSCKEKIIKYWNSKEGECYKYIITITFIAFFIPFLKNSDIGEKD